MHLIIEIILCILIGLTPIYKPLWHLIRHQHPLPWRSFFRTHRYQLFATLIILIGSLIRVIACEKYPVGLHQDEASIGYEAYSILHFGTDRNGNSFPVHLVSWASGQNALYAYLIIPFIAIFGNTTFAIRLPMALIGCISLVVTYYLFRHLFGERRLLLPLLIFAVTPWHIVKSRWGLESNIFPDLIYWSVIALYYGIKKQKHHDLAIASTLLGLSTYAYGTAYLFVPVFCCLVYSYLVYKRLLTWQKALFYLGITSIIALPMILFVIINYFQLDTVHLLCFTIPRLEHNRFTEITSINGNFLLNCFCNLLSALYIITTQTDGIVLDSIGYFGMFYLLALPFCIVGIIQSVKSSNLFPKLINATFLSAVIVSVFVIPTVYRINILWIPILFYIIYGVQFLCHQQAQNPKIIGLYYITCFIWFIGIYFGNYQKDLALITEGSTFVGINEAINFALETPHENLYITSNIREPYIFYLWNTKISPQEYLAERIVENPSTMFPDVMSIGNAYFYIPEPITPGNIYILKTTLLQENPESYPLNNFSIQEFGNYSVLY